LGTGRFSQLDRRSQSWPPLGALVIDAGHFFCRECILQQYYKGVDPMNARRGFLTSLLGCWAGMSSLGSTSAIAQVTALSNGGTMTTDQMNQFAEDWIDAWNRRDLDAVMAHFSNDAVFISPTAIPIMGMARIEGKAAIREYWTKALSRVPKMEFRLDHVLCNPEQHEMAVVYLRIVNDQKVRKCEFMKFGPDGQQIYGESFSGSDA
jgi:hypothetical protein